jgi:hypothetical protein
MSGKAAQVKFTPGQGFTKAELAQGKRFADMFPALAEKMRKNLGGPPAAGAVEARRQHQA